MKCRDCNDGERLGALSYAQGLSDHGGYFRWSISCSECGKSTLRHINLHDALDAWNRINNIPGLNWFFHNRSKL